MQPTRSRRLREHVVRAGRRWHTGVPLVEHSEVVGERLLYRELLSGKHLDIPPLRHTALILRRFFTGSPEWERREPVALLRVRVRERVPSLGRLASEEVVHSSLLANVFCGPARHVDHALGRVLGVHRDRPSTCGNAVHALLVPQHAAQKVVEGSVFHK